MTTETSLTVHCETQKNLLFPVKSMAVGGSQMASGAVGVASRQLGHLPSALILAILGEACSESHAQAELPDVRHVINFRIARV